MDMEQVVQILGIGGSLAGAVIWICKAMFNPLKETLEKVSSLLDKLNERLGEEQAERHSLEVKVQEIDDRSKSNKYRIENLEKDVVYK